MAHILEYSNLTVNFDARCACINERDIGLTKLEFSMLTYLVERNNCAVSRNELLRDIWELPCPIVTRATDDTIKRLRKKLKDHEAQFSIETVRGFGFIVK